MQHEMEHGLDICKRGMQCTGVCPAWRLRGPTVMECTSLTPTQQLSYYMSIPKIVPQ